MVAPTWEIRQGDVMERLREMRDKSVHCVVTSPPYWGLRDYGTAKWEGGDPGCAHKGKYERTGGYGSPKQATNQGANFVALGDCLCGAIRIDSQLGLELTPEDYTTKMVQVFSEVRRVLRSDGTLWLNLGDSYSGSNGNGNAAQSNVGLTSESFTPFQNVTGQIKGLKPKDLVGIPWIVAFALRADGWYLRSDIIWSKPNSMPESVTDRPTKSHEYVFLLSKSTRYYYDGDAIREPYNSSSISRYDSPMMGVAPTARQPGGDVGRREREKGLRDPNPLGRNARTVWTITTQPFSEAHFATFPERLVDRCISAGTSEKGVCGECGKPWARVVERAEGLPRERDEIRNCPPGTESDGRNNISGRMLTAWREEHPHRFLGWRRQCDHATQSVPATVLDIFSGSGTTGVVANKLGRNYIGIELNPQYVAMSERRLSSNVYQASLFA